MKNFDYFIILLIVFIVFSCRKEPVPSNAGQVKDSVVYKDVQGMVFNTCTDSGLAGIPVYLNTYFKNKLVKKYSTVSGEDGHYIFESAELHTSPSYSYAIHIPSKSGDNAHDFESCGIRGTNMIFSLEEADIYMKPRVVPKFIYMNIYFTRHSTGPETDTVKVKFEQSTYHKNVPDYPHAFSGDAYGSLKYFRGGVRNYPMGLYDVTIDTWKGGLHERKYDKLYIPYGDTAAYVVHW